MQNHNQRIRQISRMLHNERGDCENLDDGKSIPALDNGSLDGKAVL